MRCRGACQSHDRINSGAVYLGFILWVVIQMLAHPAVAKIFKQHEPTRQVRAVNLWRTKLMPGQILGNVEKRLRVLMWWRRVHQYGFAARSGIDAEIATEGRIARHRGYVRIIPAMAR